MKYSYLIFMMIALTFTSILRTEAKEKKSKKSSGASTARKSSKSSKECSLPSEDEFYGAAKALFFSIKVSDDFMHTDDFSLVTGLCESVVTASNSCQNEDNPPCFCQLVSDAKLSTALIDQKTCVNDLKTELEAFLGGRVRVVGRLLGGPILGLLILYFIIYNII
mmetsp:Transcript_24622/g.46248  ORF Transcript_24622/g.46248 Transcript_24622/m.46248 type:complete len:165 (+) Transcript_24622:172-666(+)